MKKINGLNILISSALLIMVSCTMAADSAKITINVNEAGAKISPSLYGIFFEEINRAGDGGIYAEMLENRSFEDDKSKITVWQSTGTGKISLDREKPINPRNQTSLRIDTDENGGGIVNSGFTGVGLAIEKSKKYNLSLYVRANEGFNSPVFAKLETRSGKVLGQAKIGKITTEWKKHKLTLKAKASDLTARLVLQVHSKGSVWFDMVSLFPNETWKSHGMRTDLAKMIENMNPSFVRFPGGCFVEGNRIENAVRWKQTIGDPDQRKGNWCIWGYQTTGGFGLHEFLQWAEDLDAEAMYVINCGMAHEDQVPMAQMDEYVQDALDLIEYAKGPATSKWGAKRAKAGHPKPFNLKYLEIGNENGGPLYNERYSLFHDAIKTRYPEMELISCVPKTDRELEIVDEHYYSDPKFFIRRSHMYDDYDRSGTKIYVGEYAVTRGCGTGNLIAALAEAAFMTGIEANSDHVIMSSYAPLFVNPSMKRWNPNAIVFDQGRCYGTPSYHVQAMFAQHLGDVICPVEIDAPLMEEASLKGGISLGTWSTQAEFKDIKVTTAGKTLFESDFSKGTGDFRFHGGDWKAVDGLLRQSGTDEGNFAAIGDASWGGNYTISLKARKIGGNEGFLIGFQLAKDIDRHWLNLGGWGNTHHDLEGVGGNNRVVGKIETKHWYDIRIELNDGQIDCYLDGEKIISQNGQPVMSLFAVASKTDTRKELILKVVNPSEMPITTDIKINGVDKIKPKANGWILTSASMTDENSFERPENVAPKEINITNASTGFVHTFPARSLTILRLRVKG